MREDIIWLIIAVVAIICLVNLFTILDMKKDLASAEARFEDFSNSVILEQNNATSNVSIRVTKQIPIVAVSERGVGSVNYLTVKVSPGNNNVLISTNPFLEAGLQYSMNKAVSVAKELGGLGYALDYVFNFQAGDAQLIGGGSAGGAATIAIVAALQNRQVKDGVIMTGTIEPDGSIGWVDGIVEKAKAAADSGFTTFLIPEGQGTVTYYERQVREEDTGFGFSVWRQEYVPKTIDIKEEAKSELGLEVIEVGTVQEAMPHFLE